MEVEARLIPFYQSRGITIVRGRGQYVWDDKGRRYLDLHTGYGTAFFGHCHPRIVSRIREQLETLMVCSPVFDNPTRREALRALGRTLPRHLLNVFFQNSGAEAVELAIKLVMRATRRRKFVALIGAFHGRTLGALSLTWGPKYREPFEPLPLRVERIKPNDISSIDKVVDEETAAVFVEPVIGEGGVIPLSEEFLKALYERAREVGAFFVVDEVQSGYGRTGLIWAHQRVPSLKPDVLVAGKAVGGGFPVSFAAATDEVVSHVKPGDHGSTYGGNPLACAAVVGATEVLLGEDVPRIAAEMGSYFEKLLRERLDGHRLVRDIRVAGLMIGVELRVNPTPVLKCLQERGVLALKAGTTVVRFLPPYLVTRSDADDAVGALEQCLGASQ